MVSVLVLDDDVHIVRLLGNILRMEGFQVIETWQGEKALALISREAPDVIILDLNMPEMDGRTFYRAARTAGYQGPVVICSAFSADSARFELGAEASLGKPFDPDELLAIVRALTGEKAASPPL